jgi:hypothetical protein
MSYGQKYLIVLFSMDINAQRAKTKKHANTKKQFARRSIFHNRKQMIYNCP